MQRVRQPISNNFMNERTMKKTTFIALAVSAGLALSTVTHAATPKTAFVHLFEWGWEDIAKECETFLGPKGFDNAIRQPMVDTLSASQLCVQQPKRRSCPVSKHGSALQSGWGRYLSGCRD